MSVAFVFDPPVTRTCPSAREVKVGYHRGWCIEAVVVHDCVCGLNVSVPLTLLGPLPPPPATIVFPSEVSVKEAQRRSISNGVLVKERVAGSHVYCVLFLPHPSTFPFVRSPAALSTTGVDAGADHCPTTDGSGVGDGLGYGDGEGDGLGDNDGEGDGLGDGLVVTEGVTEGLGEGETDGEGDGEGERLGVGVIEVEYVA